MDCRPLEHCIVTEEMSSGLPCDPPHPRTTKKASASAAAVQLLLRRGGRAAAKDESIEFFSVLRECQPDPRVSGHTGIGPADRKGKARRGGGDAELLSTEIGKHDYDWLLTPPATPPCFTAATSGATAVLNRLTRATSASFAKSNSPLSLARRENAYPTSRLARSSSATATHSSSVNTPASYRPSLARTLSSASSSSINAASNASQLGSDATSPRTPATARSKAQGRKVSFGSGAASQPKGSSSSSSNSGPSAPTIARKPRAPTTGASSPKSTRVASDQPALTTRRGANAVVRSRFASQLSSAMSTAQPAQNVVRSSIIKPRPVPAAVKQCHGNGTAAMSTTASSQSLLPPPFSSQSSASLATSRGDLLANKRSSGRGDYCRKINLDEVTTPRRTAGLPSTATSSGLTTTRTGSRKSANVDAKRTVADDLKPTVQQRSIRSTIASRSRPAAGSIARARWAATQKSKVTVAGRVAKAEAFPSTRYDAMLLQEDPKNLTWLNGCDEDEDAGCGIGLVEGSLELEPFNMTVAGTSGTAA